MKCDFCEASFYNDRILRNHYIKIHAEKLKATDESVDKTIQKPSYVQVKEKCHICDRILPRSYLVKHVESVHQNKRIKCHICKKFVQSYLKMFVMGLF